VTKSSLPTGKTGGPVLYLARHGETDANLKKIFQGRTDNPLNATGLAQGEALRRLFEPVPLTRAYCSPLERARVTASIILKNRSIPVSEDKRLTELDFGAWEMVPEIEVKERWMDDYIDYRSDMWRFRPEGGESARDVQARAGEWWDEISAEFASPSEHILVVAHQSINAVLACHVAGVDLREAWEHFKTRPGEVIRIIPGPVAMVSRMSEGYS
jgi:probable phosphoglycerate mutase